jgi:hypothetical protein
MPSSSTYCIASEGNAEPERCRPRSLQADGVVKLADAERVRLATNLMTVLGSETETVPVLPLSRD